jgi:hypothetical protein
MFKKQLIPQAVIGILVTVFFVAVACSDKNKSVPTQSTTTAVQLSLSGLKPLENGINYQAWVVTSDYYAYPLGIFNFNKDGKMVDVSGDTLLSGKFTIDLGLDEIWYIGISIEAQKVITETPSSTHILGGTVSDSQAVLTLDNVMGLGKSFQGATGKYILATPTDSINTNENSGIWFLDLTTGISFKGLNLPDPPSGWKYEGWVIADGTYLSTGKFSQLTAADDSAYYSGPVAGPPFPGEDFLLNAPEGLSFPLNLAGASVMITLEPGEGYDDNPGKPFFLKVLVADIPPGAADRITYDMSASSDSLPSGTAVLK